MNEVVEKFIGEAGVWADWLVGGYMPLGVSMPGGVNAMTQQIHATEVPSQARQGWRDLAIRLKV